MIANHFSINESSITININETNALLAQTTWCM